jgi:hypothetical protein
MLVGLCTDIRKLATLLRSTHQACETYGDVATKRCAVRDGERAGLIEHRIDQTERRVWFPAEITNEP